MPVDDGPSKSVGRIRADRWAYWLPTLLAALILGTVGWQAAVVFVAVVVVIRLKVNRVLQAIWPECYHAVRRAVEDDRELRT